MAPEGNGHQHDASGIEAIFQHQLPTKDNTVPWIGTCRIEGILQRYDCTFRRFLIRFEPAVIIGDAGARVSHIAVQRCRSEFAGRLCPVGIILNPFDRDKAHHQIGFYIGRVHREDLLRDLFGSVIILGSVFSTGKHGECVDI